MEGLQFISTLWKFVIFIALFINEQL